MRGAPLPNAVAYGYRLLPTNYHGRNPDCVIPFRYHAPDDPAWISVKKRAPIHNGWYHVIAHDPDRGPVVASAHYKFSAAAHAAEWTSVLGVAVKVYAWIEREQDDTPIGPEILRLKKRRRGRPRKNPITPKRSMIGPKERKHRQDQTAEEKAPDTAPAKKKRGRQPKARPAKT